MRWWPWRRKPKPVGAACFRARPVTALVSTYGEVEGLLLSEHDETFSTAVGDLYEVTDVRLSPAALAAQEQRNRIAGGDDHG